MLNKKELKHILTILFKKTFLLWILAYFTNQLNKREEGNGTVLSSCAEKGRCYEEKASRKETADKAFGKPSVQKQSFYLPFYKEEGIRPKSYKRSQEKNC